MYSHFYILVYPMYYKTQFVCWAFLGYDINHAEIKFWIDNSILFPSVATNDLYTKYEGICSNAEINVLLKLLLGKVWGFRIYTVNQAIITGNKKSLNNI